ncbi:MAG: tRNA lysidine(34) synthetase TilS [Nitratiruptor sp.]|nr:tRNA lysidine(34) synthetase TilS [Nitratiruptor sp.]NPA83071.1 tRNA lysidine(34) synthetase TilS [Campylobacterota bacterium]
MSLLALDQLRQGPNLLAFSGGSDSSALFFLLEEAGIPFDIAMVDYQRPQSQLEVDYGAKLAQEYHKRFYLKRVHLPPSNFEARARTIRYRFFEEIIDQEGYTNLITAHQLQDLLEWHLMQLGKGAGLVESVGMEVVSKRPGYALVRPLLLTPKSAILAYLAQEGITHFLDPTNANPRHLRNQIRHTFATPFATLFESGIQESFGYLLTDRVLLERLFPIAAIQRLHMAPRHPEPPLQKRSLLRLFKALGYLPSKAQQEEILRTRHGVLAGKFAYGFTEELILVAPFQPTPLPKRVKEAMRRAKIPPHLRGYLFGAGIDPRLIEEHRDRARKWLQSYRQLFASPEEGQF